MDGIGNIGKCNKGMPQSMIEIQSLADFRRAESKSPRMQKIEKELMRRKRNTVLYRTSR